MNSAAKYGAGLAFTGFALFTLITFTVGIGLLLVHDRAETKREQARERRYRSAEDRARLREESYNWQRERTEWN